MGITLSNLEEKSMKAPTIEKYLTNNALNTVELGPILEDASITLLEEKQVEYCILR